MHPARGTFLDEVDKMHEIGMQPCVWWQTQVKVYFSSPVLFMNSFTIKCLQVAIRKLLQQHQALQNDSGLRDHHSLALRQPPTIRVAPKAFIHA